MKCKSCRRFKLVSNTNETGQGICTYPDSWLPVAENDECHFELSGEVKCKDCDRLGCDFACMTCQEEDSAMHGEQLCAGFIDKCALDVQRAIAIWKARGWDYKALLEEQVRLIETAPRAYQPKK